jgi:hypothetical protein
MTQRLRRGGLFLHGKGPEDATHNIKRPIRARASEEIGLLGETIFGRINRKTGSIRCRLRDCSSRDLSCV